MSRDEPSWHIVVAIEQRLTMSTWVVNIQEEEELPVMAQPGSPEPNENNPFLSGLQQSGISITGMTALLGFSLWPRRWILPQQALNGVMGSSVCQATCNMSHRCSLGWVF